MIDPISFHHMIDFFHTCELLPFLRRTHRSLQNLLAYRKEVKELKFELFWQFFLKHFGQKGLIEKEEWLKVFDEIQKVCHIIGN